MVLYDETNPESISKYAEKLIGKTFYDVLDNNFDGEILEEKTKYYNNPRSKGGLGLLLEEHYFYYTPNSDSAPDFDKAGMELKVTPYEITKQNKIRAGERLVIGMISNSEPIETNFFTSHLFEKMNLMLLIFYLREKGNDRTTFSIDYVKMFSLMSAEYKKDLQIIKEDYKKITEKIIQGKAHELSEGDTIYLGACTKGSTAKKSLQPQYYNPDVPAKRRAFSLKQGYMTYLLNQHILNQKEEAIFTEEELVKINFDKAIVEKISQYIGKSEAELYQMFDINPKNKNRNQEATCRMLGVSSNQVEEFTKADIKIKTVRVERNGKPKESMSFPPMIINDFVKEEFEDSMVYEYFSENRFLFVVFKEAEDGNFYLAGSKFWNMPITELETIGYEEWHRNQEIFENGVEFKKQPWGKEFRISNNLPKKSETKIFHLRPHAAKAGYVIDGIKYGKGTERDMDVLPNGDKMTKQSFWLNKEYVAEIIKDI